MKRLLLTHKATLTEHLLFSLILGIEYFRISVIWRCFNATGTVKDDRIGGVRREVLCQR